jgi:signal transduction histidine kinase
LSIRDDGSGFIVRKNGSSSGHYGIVGMRERALQMGAELTIASTPGKGTLIGVLVDPFTTGDDAVERQRTEETG